jgi:hypothetical protein
MADAKRGLEMVCEGLENRDDTWFDPSVRSKAATSALLLPNYDEYFIGYKDRSAIGQRINHTTPVTGGTANITHVALIDGELVGGWKRLVEKSGVVVAIEFWSPLSKAESDKVNRVVGMLGKFLGGPVRIRATGDGRRATGVTA